MKSPAGTNTTGYRTIRIDGQVYAQHRLAFLWMTGEWPPEYVDHIDGNPRNNRWPNLRLATHQQNAQNRKRKYGSHTGLKGVIKDYRSDTWHVHMMVNKRPVSKGPFYSYQEACKEYDRLSKECFREFARQEPARVQHATFTENDISNALEDFIVRAKPSKTSMQ